VLLSDLAEAEWDTRFLIQIPTHIVLGN